ncbi:TrfB-related DNA-binding protein (plasmid) [Dyella sp. BiH032]|uniref:TrfB-related DNA-binding protein n=1 Tax=Dyella sp. BiH032 TaxID=3075430 RepID=UPI002892F48D|nr:TrfB-related DNA-binding protein [Dyella sp. BiH032]WNL48577.1 TrfB-related DNA-binding protein [Dyella sp. BiH032]
MTTSETRFERLTNDVFQRAVDRTRLSAANVELARQVLVTGRSAYAVSRETQVKPQVIYGAIKRIRAAHAKNQAEAPEGWVSVTVSVPSELVPEVKGIEQRAKGSADPHGQGR